VIRRANVACDMQIARDGCKSAGHLKFMRVPQVWYNKSSLLGPLEYNLHFPGKARELVLLRTLGKRK
jgi:hypothetical protein